MREAAEEFPGGASRPPTQGQESQAGRAQEGRHGCSCSSASAGSFVSAGTCRPSATPVSIFNGRVLSKSRPQSAGRA